MILCFLRYAPTALANGLIAQEDIDSRIRNLFRVRFRLGHFDPPGPLQTLGAGDICSDYAVELARDGATQGAVLIKNVRQNAFFILATLSWICVGLRRRRVLPYPVCA